MIDRAPRAVVIGYGFAGRGFHAYLVGITPGLELHGVASRSPETRARIETERGCRAYADVGEVLADPDVDLVILATPNSTHAELSIRALDAGKHVVTDKVMALTLADADRMIAAAKRNDRLLTVFQNRRWDGDWLTLRHCVEAGDLGDVRWLEMAWQGQRPMGGWRGRAEMGGGRFYDLGAHLIDQLCLFFPQPLETVYCRMHHDYPGNDIESQCLIVVTFAGGHTGVLDLSGRSFIRKPRFRALGDKATFEKYGLDPQERAMLDGDIDAAVPDPAEDARVVSADGDRRVPTLPGCWRSFYENIRDVLRGKAEPAVDLASVRRAMTVVDAARQSAASGRVVQIVAQRA